MWLLTTFFNVALASVFAFWRWGCIKREVAHFKKFWLHVCTLHLLIQVLMEYWFSCQLSHTVERKPTVFPISTDLLLNKLAVITGGSRGIGYAIAQNFSQNGAQCIVISKNSDKIAQAASKLNSEATVQKKHVGIACDLRNKEEIENVCKACWICLYFLSIQVVC